MRIFRNIQNYWAAKGFSANDLSPFNVKLVHHAFISLLSIVLVVGYLFYEAISGQEYMFGIFMFIPGTAVFIGFLNSIFKRPVMFKLIYSLQKLTNESK